MIQRYHEIQRQKAAGEREEGFTLIELLIVIVVLGILAAVVVFALGGVTSQSAQSSCNADAKTVQTAIAAYEAQGGTAASLTATGSTLLTGTSAVGGPYLQSWPSNGTHYSISLDNPAAPAPVPGQVDVTVGTSTVAYSASACSGAT